ncbi:MAG: phosphate acyltransferase PlsX [Desulforudis sp.]|nr:phosphate acyltransferase PlsX [Clostridia bacterium]MDQ7791109.1 phosphate acyltransferase PlsX [Clostridia bacterium]RJX17845.1 MAG: phosphate acyltransferase PlsX [Desulforudis sp.]
MRIAVDAMGGDNAPSEIVKGAVMAAEELGIRVLLLGDESRLREEVQETAKLRIVHAGEVIGMSESPVSAVRRKKESSIVKAVQMVKDGMAEGVVSAGHTGATMAAGLLILGRIRGVERPALVGMIPHLTGCTVLLDVGANVDCRPSHLLQFAVMGSKYAEKGLGIVLPRVGLLSNGEENSKGNEQTLAAYPLLERAPIHFIGNVEGRDLFNGRVDVVVCDGFIGNIVLKTGEGLAKAFSSMIKKQLAASWMAKMSAVAAAHTLRDIRRRFDYSEYGGVPLLGVNGVVVVSHGSSKAKAIKNAIGIAAEASRLNLAQTIGEGIGEVFVKGAGTVHA